MSFSIINAIGVLENEKTLLKFPGITRDDLIRVCDSSQEIKFTNKVYDKIPSVFVNLQTWPKSTNLHCWWCRRKIQDIPWSEPTGIEPDGKSHHCFNVKGIYCSPNCVRANIDSTNKRIEFRNNTIEMLKLFHKALTGLIPEEIVASPHFSELQEFGGSMTSDDYQKAIEESQKTINEYINSILSS